MGMERIKMKIIMNRRRLQKSLGRRQFSYAAYLPERRSGMDRRLRTTHFFFNVTEHLEIFDQAA